MVGKFIHFFQIKRVESFSKILLMTSLTWGHDARLETLSESGLNQKSYTISSQVGINSSFNQVRLFLETFVSNRWGLFFDYRQSFLDANVGQNKWISFSPSFRQKFLEGWEFSVAPLGFTRSDQESTWHSLWMVDVPLGFMGFRFSNAYNYHDRSLQTGLESMLTMHKNSFSSAFVSVKAEFNSSVPKNPVLFFSTGMIF